MSLHLKISEHKHLLYIWFPEKTSGIYMLWRIDPLLSGSLKATTVSGQRLVKHVRAVTNTQGTIDLLLEMGCFLCRPCRDIIRRTVGSVSSTRVNLRVVGGDEKESLKSETVKYCRQSQRTRTRERLRWQEPAAYTKNRPVLSSERAPHKNKTVTVKQ
jgi:hypothetical protein